MNLRVKTGELRFRVSEREFGKLLEGEALREIILFTDGAKLTLLVSVNDYLDQSYSLNFKNSSIELLLSKNFLERNREVLERKDGVVFEEKNLKIIFQVDIFSKDKK